MAVRRNHRKCQRYGRNRWQPVELETPAGTRRLCAKCRNLMLFEYKRPRKKPKSVFIQAVGGRSTVLRDEQGGFIRIYWR
jgi:hypothetical protein